VTEALGDRTIEVGAGATVELVRHFSDPDGDALAFAVVSSDTKVAAAEIAGDALTVTAVAKGAATVTVTATDTEGLSTTRSFLASVPNRPPLATGALEERTLEVGEAATLDLSGYFTDPDGDDLSYAASATDADIVAIELAGGIVTVTALGKGATSVAIRATDTDGLAASRTWAIRAANRPPEPRGSIADATIEVGRTVTLELTRHFGDPDGDILTYTATSAGTGVASLSLSGGAVTVTAVARGEAEVTVTATDPEGLSATLTFVVTVPNRTPAAVGAVPKMSLKKGGIGRVHPWSYFSDPDDDALVYDASSSDVGVAKAWMARNGVVVRGMDKGTTTVILTAEDPEGLLATLLFEVRVDKSGGSGSNKRPTVVGTVGTQELEPDDSRTLNAASYFDDPDDDPLTFSATTSDAGVVRAAVSGNRITLDAVAEGAATVTLGAKDPDGLAASLDFGVEVAEGEEPNRAPVRVGRILDQSLEEGDGMRIDGSSYFRDPDDDELSFSAESSDAAVASAKVSGSEVTLSAGAEGSATVTITAKDPDGLSVASNFTVTVSGDEEENRPPRVVGKILAQELEEGDTRTVDGASYFSDPDGDDLEFSAASSEDEAVTVKVSGSKVTLSATGAGKATVTLTANDPDELSASLDFDVTVSEAAEENRPPAVVGRIPAQSLEVDEKGTVDGSSHFTDPDDDDLEFSARSSDAEVVTAKVSGSTVTLSAVAEGTATVTITAKDPDGLSATSDLAVTVSEEEEEEEEEEENRPPKVVGQILAQDLEEGDKSMVEAASYFNDPDEDELEFSAESADTEVVEATMKGTEVELEVVDEGTTTVKVTAKDPEGLKADQEFGVTVKAQPPNKPPQVKTVPFWDVYWGDPLLEDVTLKVIIKDHFQDPDDDYPTLTVTAESTDEAVVRIESADTDTVKIVTVAEGWASVTVTVTDPDGRSASKRWGVKVKDVAPEVRSEGKDFVIAVDEETTRSFSFYIIDCNIGDSLTFTVSNSDPAVLEATADGRLARFKGLTVGKATIEFMAEDRTGLTAKISFTVTVDGNRPPVIVDSIPREMTLTEGDRVKFVLTDYFDDPDGDELSYSELTQKRISATIRGDTLWLSADEPGKAYFSVTATDPDGRKVWQSSWVTVEEDSDLVWLPGLHADPAGRLRPVARVVAVAGLTDHVPRPQHREWPSAYRTRPRAPALQRRRA